MRTPPASISARRRTAARAASSLGIAEPTEPDHVPGRDVIGVQQRLRADPATEERIPRVARVVHDRAHRRPLPAITGPVAVLVRTPRGRATDPVAIEAVRDPPIPPPVQILGEDPRHHLGGVRVEIQHPQPIALGGLARVRMRPSVKHAVAVGRPATLMAAFVDDLRVHRRPHPGLHVLTLRLRHTAEHTHQHLVRRIVRVEPPTQLRYPQLNAVGSEARRDQRELVAEPAPGALTDHDRPPATVAVLQRRQQSGRLRPTIPRHRPRLADVEVLGDDLPTKRFVKPARGTHLPPAHGPPLPTRVTGWPRAAAGVWGGAGGGSHRQHSPRYAGEADPLCSSARPGVPLLMVRRLLAGHAHRYCSGEERHALLRAPRPRRCPGRLLAG